MIELEPELGPSRLEIHKHPFAIILRGLKHLFGGGLGKAFADVALKNALKTRPDLVMISHRHIEEDLVRDRTRGGAVIGTVTFLQFGGVKHGSGDGLLA